MIEKDCVAERGGTYDLENPWWLDAIVRSRKSQSSATVACRNQNRIL